MSSTSQSSGPHTPSPSDAELIRGSAFFDAAFYLGHNPDVSASGADPATHYLINGAQEGRDPSPDFSSAGYLAQHPDVAALGMNPLVHFLRSGMKEGRDTGVDAKPTETTLRSSGLVAHAKIEDRELLEQSQLFDPEYYLRRYPDVASARLDPIAHYLASGVHEHRDPSEAFSTLGYLRRHKDVAAVGLNPLVHYLKHGKAEGRTIVPGRPLIPPFDELCQQRWGALKELAVFPTPFTQPRLTIVTDSVSPSWLFGGVGTAIILGTLLANRLGASLRLVTRTDEPDARALSAVLTPNKLKLNGSFETVFIPNDGSVSLSLTPNDLFLTTSWWSTRAILNTVPTDRVMYLLQEDERMFYPYGDDRLQCAETLAEPGLVTVINTRLLHAHLTRGPDPIAGLDARALSFEPAFANDSANVAKTTDVANRKLRFFFYSRPHNLRNMFWRGAAAICDAVEHGTLDPKLWDFYFVGKETPKFTLPGGVQPNVIEGLSWTQYQELVASMDAAFVLMDTPHPSYPPLDMASVGVAVLTNRHGLKTDLSSYSKNILVAEPTFEGLREGFVRLAELARNPDIRRDNRESDGIARDWEVTLGQVVEQLAISFGPRGGANVS